MLTAAAVATMLGLKPRTVYDLADSGRLPCYRMGVGRGAVRFDPADMEAYRAACRSTRTSAPAAGASTSTAASPGTAAFANVAFFPLGGVERKPKPTTATGRAPSRAPSAPGAVNAARRAESYPPTKEPTT